MEPVEYVPRRWALWRWALVRTYWFPKRRWARMMVGPAFTAAGATMVFGVGPFTSTAWGELGGALLGIGVVWTVWPLLGAAFAVTRSGAVRKRTAVRLAVVGRVLELVRDDDRVLFALRDLLEVRTVFGLTFALFRGDRAVMLPREARSGSPEVLAAVLRAQLTARPGPTASPTP
jgi:hypothetical protein